MNSQRREGKGFAAGVVRHVQAMCAEEEKVEEEERRRGWRFVVSWLSVLAYRTDKGDGDGVDKEK